MLRKLVWVCGTQIPKTLKHLAVWDIISTNNYSTHYPSLLGKWLTVLTYIFGYNFRSRIVNSCFEPLSTPNKIIVAMKDKLWKVKIFKHVTKLTKRQTSLWIGNQTFIHSLTHNKLLFSTYYVIDIVLDTGYCPEQNKVPALKARLHSKRRKFCRNTRQ